MKARRDDVAMNERSAMSERAMRPLRCSRGKGLMSKFESLIERIISSPVEGDDTSLTRVTTDIFEAVFVTIEP
jgi:hypothetical protein